MLSCEKAKNGKTKPILKWIIKTNKDLAIEWNKTYGGSEIDWVEDIIQSNDGGFVIYGQTGYKLFKLTDIWVIKTDANGDALLPQILID